jgi:signal transduction histidine kinase
MNGNDHRQSQINSNSYYNFSVLAGVILIVLIISFAVWQITQSRNNAYRTARIEASNLSQILSDNLINTIESIDFGILAILDELKDQEQKGIMDEARILKVIANQDQRNPSAVGFRIFGPDGKRRYAVSTVNSREADLSEREDFKYLRDTPDPGLFVSKPVFGITAQQWIIIVARRITRADGSFGGTIYGPIPIKKLTQTFSRLNLGANGSVALYHQNLNLAARFPEFPDLTSKIGTPIINQTSRSFLESGQREGAFEFVAAIDGIKRFGYIRKVGSYPYFVQVGLADTDFLEEPRSDALRVELAAGLMIIIIITGMALVRQSSKRNAEVAQAVQAEAAAQAANQAKTMFLSTMSHELRTPINAISNYCALIKEDAMELGAEHLVDDLSKIESACGHLLTIVNDILDIAKIEAGKMDFLITKVDLAGLVASVENIAQTLAHRNENQFVLVVAGELAEMTTDDTKLRQSLLNLISNALKFTHSGTVRLYVRATDTKVDFSVTDTGIGIKDEQLQYLFQPFVQADARIAQRFGGTGLGLSLTRTFVEQLGGSVAVQSTFGAGSTFTISLPRHTSKALEPMSARAGTSS